MSRRRLLARCPACNRQHEFVSVAQAQRMTDAGGCKFCPLPGGQEWDHDVEAEAIRALDRLEQLAVEIRDAVAGRRDGSKPTCSTTGCDRSVDSYAGHGKCCLVCGIEAAAGTHLAYCRRRHDASVSTTS